ncbi:PQQ-dependent sugar dehydrogenase [Fodinibius salsisoli]|uniref:PQQ-dependent sugar dehydrogenase n=1 Tax=Fodinibius salsisoli TaxID=2820877 RepID=A0ABT3PJ74_9BACT|nr:PQQ-dependent sugar dehydrogenase [Fodinibius salsisoli]MCW9705991.1 PQQ-dependent sugar dehydrogenase [Fodinibius salsisoli]
MHLTFLIFFMFVTGCSAADKSSDQSTDNPAIDNAYHIEEAFPELEFTRPVDLQDPGDGSNRLFVVEQRGIISVFPNDPQVQEVTTFLDIEERVDDRSNEEGLLGLAFHPDYQQNGYFYVNYTTPDSKTHISRFQVAPDDPDKAVASSEQVLLSYEQPYGNHNGGGVAFGPDGYFYIAVGDGGSGGDPHGHGQNRKTLLSNILRIDVDNPDDGKKYGIPSDNPFVNNDQGYREEIYAYGLRNVWRFSFDPENGRLWAGDVGQNRFEEIDIVKKGGNYGWNTMEAKHCFSPKENCNQSGLEPPVWEYDRSQGDVSVTGGFVYRGPSHAELQGLYIYADYVSGRIWALDYSDMDNPVNTEIVDANVAISSFGVDADNELYLCAFDGNIYKLSSE